MTVSAISINIPIDAMKMLIKFSTQVPMKELPIAAQIFFLFGSVDKGSPISSLPKETVVSILTAIEDTNLMRLREKIFESLKKSSSTSDFISPFLKAEYILLKSANRHEITNDCNLIQALHASTQLHGKMRCYEH